MRIYNHNLFGTSPDILRLAGAELYASRALALTMPGDVVQLPQQAAGEYDWIAEHYCRIGLECSQHVIWNLDLRVTSEHSHLEPCFYMFDGEAHKARPDAEWLDVCTLTNSKNRFLETCIDLGVPVPRTQTYLSFPGSLESISFPCWAKLDCSCSGLGVWKCCSADDLLRLSEFLRNPFQLQEELQPDVWLNVQYEEHNRRAIHLATTEQILSGSCHQGNRYPTPYDCTSATDLIADWMVDKGMKGVFAFDVAVFGRGPAAQYLIIECNPRYNGATYFHKMAERLGESNWVGRNFATGYRTLQSIEFGDLEYVPARHHGVIVVNWGTVRVGKLGALLVGTPAQQAVLERELEAVLHA